jgi:hypothetical protein
MTWAFLVRSAIILDCFALCVTTSRFCCETNGIARIAFFTSFDLAPSDLTCMLVAADISRANVSCFALLDDQDQFLSWLLGVRKLL